MERLAQAKVNLGLSLLGRRPDGYHELHTLFAALSFGDRLLLEPIPEGIEFRGPYGQKNLAYRAARAYLEAAGWPGGVRIVLEKALPEGAGLGGGSSDAAQVLLALKELYPAAVDFPALALSLGADVPFFLLGGVAEARGVGERLRPLLLSPLWAVVFAQGPRLPTPKVYGEARPHDYGPELPVEAILRALGRGEEPPYWNSLEGPAFRLHPELRRVKEELRSLGLRGVLMSGSGSAFFGLAEDEAHARRAAEALRPKGYVRYGTLGGGHALH
ncbi:4-(cytidine 5'-diphospho)-2-C-methyl-D-erythritol kinase [Thermus thermamylovorans]|uniref:4-diphosphocytidyl-2-C-methyl-D-erythritol kinase n=1 Tax=Thermus thermamylovorans TaxID=2509362 RepID=A0A4Q9B6P7_9DEIN|nr:4-(cytidine 5'-diphospho)-2-C-methyl-D-erythritol kinase [Thermus thermamylovorans]TBH20762.1 4-(cytidine 5'-diphospho)-2-C-methyl-D-erythritol kinase [Thermus thermamylovorans]